MKLSKELYDTLLKDDVSALEQMWDEFEGITYDEDREQDMKRLYFDLDGVLATWQEKLKNDFIMPNGDIIPKGSPVTDELWNNPITHYYATIPPYQAFAEFVNDLCLNKDVEVFVLSKSPSFAIRDKLSWVHSVLPNLPKDHILLCPYGEYPKTNFLGHLSKDDYLFDDFSPNLKEWHDAGGFAVNVLNGVNHSEKRFPNLPNYDMETVHKIFDEYILNDITKEWLKEDEGLDR